MQKFLFNTLQCTGESVVTTIAAFMNPPVNPAALGSFRMCSHEEGVICFYRLEDNVYLLQDLCIKLAQLCC